jgi:hypothetical protein
VDSNVNCDCPSVQVINGNEGISAQQKLVVVWFDLGANPFLELPTKCKVQSTRATAGSREAGQDLDNDRQLGK